MQLNDGIHTITIEKELFDIGILHAVNRILHSREDAEAYLYLSIDDHMQMVFLHLDKEKWEAAYRMGLVV